LDFKKACDLGFKVTDGVGDWPGHRLAIVALKPASIDAQNLGAYSFHNRTISSAIRRLHPLGDDISMLIRTGEDDRVTSATLLKAEVEEEE
jgi:hypothetical protein